MASKYNVSDGKLLLTLDLDQSGWYTVTSPMQPGLTTQARSIPEAFENARDAIKELRAARQQLYGRKSKIKTA